MDVPRANRAVPRFTAKPGQGRAKMAGRALLMMIVLILIRFHENTREVGLSSIILQRSIFVHSVCAAILLASEESISKMK